MANPNSRVAAEGGSGLYVGTGTYKTSDNTLRPGTISIYIRADQAAMITSYKLKPETGGTGEYTDPLDKISGVDLLAGDLLTFPHPLSEIVIADGSFIGYEV